MTKVAILGAGEIGRAVYQIILNLREVSKKYLDIEAFVIDSNKDNIFKLVYGSHYVMDLDNDDSNKLSKFLIDQKVTHVINALPFFLNERIAVSVADANCHYIDFTEDDKMADRVQEIFRRKNLTCSVKCGLAPGFINYIGYDLVSKMDKPESLMISVGALPRTISYDVSHPELSYNLTWSVDGLVNEYIRPCRVRRNGIEDEIPPLSGQTKVILDGIEYEAACTSGGVGSLVRDLSHVPNVQYMTLRYPGHYRYVRSVVQDKLNNFEEIKKIFKEKFPYTRDDVIVVYASLTGTHNGCFTRTTYYNKFYGVDGLTGIQSTTAGSGVAALELILSGKISGIITHSDIKLSDFCETDAFRRYYKV